MKPCLTVDTYNWRYEGDHAVERRKGRRAREREAKAEVLAENEPDPDYLRVPVYEWMHDEDDHTWGYAPYDWQNDETPLLHPVRL